MAKGVCRNQDSIVDTIQPRGEGKASVSRLLGIGGGPSNSVSGYVCRFRRSMVARCACA